MNDATQTSCANSLIPHVLSRGQAGHSSEGATGLPTDPVRCLAGALAPPLTPAPAEVPPGGQQELAQVLESLPPMWEAQMSAGLLALT